MPYCRLGGPVCFNLRTKTTADRNCCWAGRQTPHSSWFLDSSFCFVLFYFLFFSFLFSLFSFPSFLFCLKYNQFYVIIIIDLYVLVLTAWRSIYSRQLHRLQNCQSKQGAEGAKNWRQGAVKQLVSDWGDCEGGHAVYLGSSEEHMLATSVKLWIKILGM